MTWTTKQRYQSSNIWRGKIEALLLIIGTIMLSILGHPHEVGVVALFIAIFIEWRFLVVGIETNERGITVRQLLWKKYFFTWEEIDYLEVAPLRRYPNTLWVRIKNGKKYCTLGIALNDNTTNSHDEIQRIADELNQTSLKYKIK